ncbi:FAD/NAD(P)-binding protein [Gymnodinialimonas sp. 2305UL16-5]|uniref:FAD/NAD(P)-binding protein n=1 Tax=Gymnodinialimonas mytili TaxID=3126503 RepID=UPI0030B22C90
MTVSSLQETPAKTHVVVGDGITALAFVEGCALPPGSELVVLGQNASELGRGVAYAKGESSTPWRYAYLLNSPADDIDPAFAAWLSDRWEDVAEIMAGRSPNWLEAAQPLVATGDIYGVNAPREFYGDFMREKAEAIVADLTRRGVNVRFIDDIAIDLELTAAGVVLTTGTGARLSADTVDIAPGGPATLRLEGDDGPFAAPSVFGHEARIAEHIQAGAEIFCIGGNASMLDVLRLCQSLIPEDQLRFAVCAPDGDIPEPLIPRLPRKLTRPDLAGGHSTAESFLAEIWREIELARRNGDEMREIRAGFRAHFLENPLTQYVLDAEEALRVPATLRFWLRGGTRDTILDMRRLVGDGQIRVLPGFVNAVEHGAGGASVSITDAAGGESCVETGFVVNCAGAGATSRYDPLTERLLATGLIEICPISRGLKVGAGCRTKAAAVRHLSPATTVIGDEAMAMPLYDAHMLRTYAARAQQI